MCGQGLPWALWSGAPLARPAGAELCVTGVSLALLSYDGGRRASAPAAAPRPPAGPSRAAAGPGGAGDSSSPSACHPVADSARGQHSTIGAAGDEGLGGGPREGPAGGPAPGCGGAASGGAGRGGADGGARTGAGGDAGVVRYEVLRQWGFSATLLVVSGRWAGGAGRPQPRPAAEACTRAKSPVPEPDAGGEAVGGTIAAHGATNGAAGPAAAGAAPARSGAARTASRASLAEGTPSAGEPPRKGLPKAAAGHAGARTAAARGPPRGAPSGVEVRVEVALRALAPVLSAGAAAAALRMAERAGRYAAFWRHWRCRPSVPVAAAPIAW